MLGDGEQVETCDPISLLLVGCFRAVLLPETGINISSLLLLENRILSCLIQSQAMQHNCIRAGLIVTYVQLSARLYASVHAAEDKSKGTLAGLLSG